jgi:hypothetical protein
MKRRHAFVGWSPRLARPSTVVLTYSALAGAAAVVGVAAGVPWRLTLIVSVACIVVGLGQTGLVLLGLARRRRAADRLLHTGVNVHPESELLTWRAAELTADRNRKVLAGSLRRMVREVERPAIVTAVPVNRRGLRPKLALVRSLIDRVADVERPVAAQGMVLVEELLTDGFESPLYVGGRVTDVSASIERCLAALDSRRDAPDPSLESDTADLRSRQRPRARVHSGGGLR